MSTETTNSGDGSAGTEYIEREYRIEVYPDADWADELIEAKEQGDPDGVESDDKHALREFVRPFVVAYTDYDVDETRERTNTSHVVTVGFEDIELTQREFNAMMRAAANSSEVSGLHFDEQEEVDVRMRNSPKHLFSKATYSLLEQLPDEFDLGTDDPHDVLYTDSTTSWKSGNGEQSVSITVPYSASGIRSHPETNRKVPSVYCKVNIQTYAEAAVDLLDNRCAGAFMELLREVDLDGRSFVIETGEVETEVCKRTSE